MRAKGRSFLGQPGLRFVVYIPVVPLRFPVLMCEGRWMLEKRIVFAGGGHAHLYSLARTQELVRRGFDVTLVDRSAYLY